MVLLRVGEVGLSRRPHKAKTARSNRAPATIFYAFVAQLAEHSILTRQVVGSTPTGRTIFQRAI